MESKTINLWKPIEFNENWAQADTSILDDLAQSWFKQREKLKDNKEDYEEFLVRLKRQSAIETGVIEKLYDLSEGITETFICDGFVESYIRLDDTNIPTKQLMGYLTSHLNAIDYVFDVVKNERILSVHFIKELHQLITKYQDYTTGIDCFGNRVQIELLKGQFKKNDNNPKREDGTIYKYCPPIHVEVEMDKLIINYVSLWEQKVNPIIIASWVHHAFTQIHPFQDGNGRIARLIASLILIKGNLFPFIVKRNEKTQYIDALEKADNNSPKELVNLFCHIQKGYIEEALNYKAEKIKTNNLADVAKLFKDKIEVTNSKKKEARQSQLEKNRNLIFDNIYKLIGDIKEELCSVIAYEEAQIRIESVKPNDEKHYWYTQQIVKYAQLHKYYFNRNFSRGWFNISFTISSKKRYDLVISIHHYSYIDSVMAIGSFIELSEILEDDKEEKTTIPIHVRPFTISLETSDSSKQFVNLNQYIRDNVQVALMIITNEIV